MSDELDPLGPLEPLAEDLFRAERDHVAPVDPARAARLYAKVAETVAFTAPSVDVPPQPAEPAASSSSSSSSSPPVSPALTAKTLAPWVLSAFFGGVVAGVLARGALQTPSPVVPPPSTSTSLVVPVPSVSTSAPLVSPSASVVPEPSAAASSSAPPSKPAVPQAPSSDSAPQSLDKSLTAERALVERARVALSRHQGSMALDALAEHEATFPRGRLIEEREALRIRALVDAGRVSEAEAKARTFRARWPNSVFLSAVDLAVAPR